MRTSGLLLMDTPLPDGQIWLPARAGNFSGAGIVQNSNGTSGYGVGIPNGQNSFGSFFGEELLLRYGMSDDAQQQYGKGAPSGGYQGAQGQAVTSTTPFTTPYGITGRPPFTTAQLLAAVTGRPKGLRVDSITLAYSIVNTNITSAQVGLTAYAYTAGQANPTQTVLLTLGANGMVTTLSANWINVTVPMTSRVFLTTPLTQLVGTVNFVTGTGTVNIAGMWLNVSLNYN